MAPKNHVVRTLYPVARSHLSALLLPLLTLGALVYALFDLERRMGGTNVDVDIPLPYWGVSIGVPLAFFLWGSVKQRFSARYRVTMDSVATSQGPLRRHPSELRFDAIASIDVEQTLLGRVLLYGDVVFSTEADGGTRLVFARVGHPKQIKQFVDDLVARRGETPALPEPADEAPERPAPKAAPKRSAPKAAPKASSEDDERDELYRLLAEQEAALATDETKS